MSAAWRTSTMKDILDCRTQLLGCSRPPNMTRSIFALRMVSSQLSPASYPVRYLSIGSSPLQLFSSCFWGGDAFFLIQTKIHIHFLLKSKQNSLIRQTYLLPVNNFCHLSCCTSVLQEVEIQSDFLGLCLVDTKRTEVICGLHDIYS